MTEYAVLGILAERRAHGFALARELEPDSDVGRIFTVRRPLVYRALDRLVELGLAEPDRTEKSDSGPERLVMRATNQGRRVLRQWLQQPVDHVREIRLGFLLKVGLLRRSGHSPVPLIRSQRHSLEGTLQALDEPTTDDHVEIWRRSNARAAVAYLTELESIYD